MTESEAALSAVQANEPSRRQSRTQFASTSPAATIVVGGAGMGTPSSATLTKQNH
jgi:hypothetical protein